MHALGAYQCLQPATTHPLLRSLSIGVPMLPPTPAYLLLPLLPLQTGGMALQVARLPGTSNVTAAVFARWLSLVYMTLVQLGAVFSGG